jgi:hypothetical protein
MKEELLQIYKINVKYPDVSGFEHLETLQIRDKLALIETELSDKRKLESLLMRLIEHLLILNYWDSERERNRGYWEREILNFRLQIIRELEDSPSLKNYLKNRFDDCYQKGCKLAAKHSQIPLNRFTEKAHRTS